MFDRELPSYVIESKCRTCSGIESTCGSLVADAADATNTAPGVVERLLPSFTVDSAADLRELKRDLAVFDTEAVDRTNTTPGIAEPALPSFIFDSAAALTEPQRDRLDFNSDATNAALNTATRILPTFTFDSTTDLMERGRGLVGFDPELPAMTAMHSRQRVMSEIRTGVRELASYSTASRRSESQTTVRGDFLPSFSNLLDTKQRLGRGSEAGIQPVDLTLPLPGRASDSDPRPADASSTAAAGWPAALKGACGPFLPNLFKVPPSTPTACGLKPKAPGPKPETFDVPPPLPMGHFVELIHYLEYHKVRNSIIDYNLYHVALNAWNKCDLATRIEAARAALCEWLTKYLFVFDAKNAPQLIVNAADNPALPAGANVTMWPRNAAADLDPNVVHKKEHDEFFQDYNCVRPDKSYAKWYLDFTPQYRKVDNLSSKIINGPGQGYSSVSWLDKEISASVPRAYLAFTLNRVARNEYHDEVLPHLVSDVWEQLSETWKTLLRGRSWYTPAQLTDAVARQLPGKVIRPIGPAAPVKTLKPCDPLKPQGPLCKDFDLRNPADAEAAKAWGTHWSKTAAEVLAKEPLRTHCFVQFVPYVVPRKYWSQVTPSKASFDHVYEKSANDPSAGFGIDNKAYNQSNKTHPEKLHDPLTVAGIECAKVGMCPSSPPFWVENQKTGVWKTNCAKCEVPVWVPYLKTAVEQLLEVAAKATSDGKEACLFVLGWGYRPRLPANHDKVNSQTMGLHNEKLPPLAQRLAVNEIMSIPPVVRATLPLNIKDPYYVPAGHPGYANSELAYIEDWNPPPAPVGRVKEAESYLWHVSNTYPKHWIETRDFVEIHGGWVWPNSVWQSKLGLPPRVSDNGDVNKVTEPDLWPPRNRWRWWEMTRLKKSPPVPAWPAEQSVGPSDPQSSFLHNPLGCKTSITWAPPPNTYISAAPLGLSPPLPVEISKPCNFTLDLCTNLGAKKFGSDVQNFPNGLMDV